ncbi:MAG: prolyl oligopeptidase family serine peptidase [Bacteroidota bacterium]
MKRITLFLLIIIAGPHLFAQPLKYPTARRTEVVDNYFGQFVYDPYRWMENDRSAETEQWVKDENSVTESYLNQIPFRNALKDSMKALWNFNTYSLPFRAGKSYFYYRQEANQNQPLLFYMRSLEYVPMSYFDQNKLSADGTTHITESTASEDGYHIAFQVSYAGSDWNEIRIKETKTMKTLPEVLKGIKFSSTAWYYNGFFYSRYDIDSSKAIYTLKNENHRVFYHTLNTEQGKDSLVFEDKEHPLRNFSATVTEDNNYLLLFSSEATSGNNVLLQDLKSPKKSFTTIVKGFDYDFSYIGTVSGKLLFMTNYKAPQNRLVLIDPKSPAESNWKDLIPASADIIKDATLALDKLIVHYMKDASSHLKEYTLQGVYKGEIMLSGIGTVDGLSGSIKDTNLFISFTNFVSPPIIYRYNVVTSKLYNQFKTPLPYEANQFETSQLFYTSKDGTKIPMFIVHKKGVKLDGNNPTLLFGYGGFNISKTPEFKPERLIFLMKGGVLAVPCLRGGGEYGSKWHEAGTQLKKQNVFDDFIAAAEYLIANKYTNPSKLAIGGRSNGGLLIGAVMLQRPELFKVALPAVGVMDMLRYHKFTIGWSWKGDYGTSDDSLQFKNLIKYSPLHNIKENVEYPCTFVTTGDHDDRVVPAHSFKFAATLQNKYKGDRPMLIRIDSNAGHGAGKPKFKLIDEQADIFTFLFYNLEMSL